MYSLDYKVRLVKELVKIMECSITNAVLRPELFLLSL